MVNKGIFVKTQITNWLDVFTNFFHRFLSVCQFGIWYLWNYLMNLLKGVFSQTLWKVHCCAKFLFLELETSNFGYLLIFWFPLTMQSFSKIGQHWFNTFYKGPPFDVFWFCNLPKIHRGDQIKCLISMLSNLTETLHS